MYTAPLRFVEFLIADLYDAWAFNAICKKCYFSVSSTGKSQSATIRIKFTEQYFSVVLSPMLRNVVPTLKTVDEILKFDHSNESY